VGYARAGSSPAFGTINKYRGLADSSVNPLSLLRVLGQRFSQHFSKNLPFYQQLSGYPLNGYGLFSPKRRVLTDP